MRIFRKFVQLAPNKVFIAIVLGAAAGILYSFLFPLLLNVLRPEDGRFQEIYAEPTLFFRLEVSNVQFALVFVAICVFVLIARTFSQVILARVAMTVAADLRIMMYKQISNAPIVALETLGPSRLIATLTTDIPRIVTGARLLPDIITNTATLLGMLGFLFYLNSSVFWFTLGSIVVGGITYQVPVYFARKFFHRSRFHIDRLQEAIRGLLYGAKELKLSHKKRFQYYSDVLVDTEMEILRADKWGQTIIRIAMNYANMLSFFVIGAVSFIFVNYHAISNAELIGVIMALLYVSGPVTMLLNVVPQLTITRVSVRKVEQIITDLPAEAQPLVEHAPDDWSSIEFQGVEFQYSNNSKARSFKMGPVDFSINRGEVLFIVGGNGSGKSTLSKLITLHYLPDAGTIKYDGQTVDASNVSAYRQHICAIYSDYYLFDQLLGLDKSSDWQRIDDYLELFDLKKRISFDEGRFSSTKLSDGQRRRLALIVALMEERQLYLFDEWAADQDPSFKKTFYLELLPKLKAQGKAVVVISHDDRFFTQADRIMVLEEGSVVMSGDQEQYEQRTRSLLNKEDQDALRSASAPV